MPDHPLWPAELVEKGARAICEAENARDPVTLRYEDWREEYDAEALAVLSALSGDLVPREEHDNTLSWIAPLRDKAAQADALAEALEEAAEKIEAVDEAEAFGDDYEAEVREVAFTLRRVVASYRKTASGETEG